jgi:membrane-bound lytic murein transglycosylase MltF
VPAPLAGRPPVDCMRKLSCFLICLRLAFAILVALAPSVAHTDERSLVFAENWTGDLDGIIARRTLRLLLPYSKTLFFIDRGQEFGLLAEVGRALEQWLDTRHSDGVLRFRVIMIPKSREQLVPALLAGEGDVIAGGLAVRPEFADRVDFIEPWFRNQKEFVVTGPSSPDYRTLDDLAGSTAHVRVASSYAANVAELNKKLAKKNLRPIEVHWADGSLNDEDMFELVNAGILPYAFAHTHLASIWTQVLPNLKARPDLQIGDGEDIAWGIRKHSPRLKAELDAFVKSHAIGTTFGNAILRRYYADTHIIKNSLANDDVEKFTALAPIFRKYGEIYGIDYLMLAAQGYQESGLDQSKRSPRGAVGVMQMLPSTARAKPISVSGVERDADANIMAAAGYLRYLRDNFVNDPALDERNRMLMMLAAYNAGPGNLREFRTLARGMGLDPDLWFGNVEHAAARKVGIETVQYVGNIYKYYLAYRFVIERERKHAEARDREFIHPAAPQFPNPAARP